MDIAIVGATGLVGREVLNILYDKGLMNGNKIYLYASCKSHNKRIKIKQKRLIVKELSIKNLKNKYDFALFCAGGEISKNWAKEFVKRGALVIDNSSMFRRDADVPLIVPEVNADDMGESKIIANPNCSTIGACLPIYAIGKEYNVKRVIVSTYQAVSGAGQHGVSDLKKQTSKKFKYKIANNLIPQIDKPLKNGYTFEEDKMEYELKKILNNKKLKISATCVRVPIENCHSESIYIELDEVPNILKVVELLKEQKGICLANDLDNYKYPMPILSNKKDEVYVGRIRQDTSNKKAISLYISFDNLRKGASLNAVQIMEHLIRTKHYIDP